MNKRMGIGYRNSNFIVQHRNRGKHQYQKYREDHK